MLLIQGNKRKLNSVGCVNQQVRSIGLKLRLMILFTTLIFASGCTEFALLASGSSIAISQNSYARMYNAVDMGVVLTTKKGIKTHAYEKGKKYIVDWAKAKALGITTQH
jgi:uncharacterized membrane protein